MARQIVKAKLKNDMFFYVFVLLILSAGLPEASAGGGPTQNLPAAKVIVRGADESPRAPSEAKGAPVMTQGKIKMKVHQKSNLVTQKELYAEFAEKEEQILKQVKHDMFDFQVKDLLGEPNSVRDVNSMFGRAQRWDYYGLGNSSTVRLLFRNKRLIDIEKLGHMKKKKKRGNNAK